MLAFLYTWWDWKGSSYCELPSNQTIKSENYGLQHLELKAFRKHTELIKRFGHLNITC